MVPELAIRYDNNLRPTSAQCSTCGQHMPAPPSEVRDTADVLMWFSDQFVEHRTQKHPTPPYGGSDPEGNLAPKREAH